MKHIFFIITLFLITGCEKASEFKEAEKVDELIGKALDKTSELVDQAKEKYHNSTDIRKDLINEYNIFKEDYLLGFTNSITDHTEKLKSQLNSDEVIIWKNLKENGLPELKNITDQIVVVSKEELKKLTENDYVKLDSSIDTFINDITKQENFFSDNYNKLKVYFQETYNHYRSN